MRIINILADDIDSPAILISSFIKEKLKDNKKVLWLVSGGSAINVAVRARELVGTINQNYTLHVVLSDERYGDIGHPDSNMFQLTEAGFDTNGLSLHSVLNGQDIETTAKNYNDILKNLVENVDAIIGLFGMGSDGHTTGLLPGNPLMNSLDFVGFFDGFDFQRITTTPALLSHVNEAVLYAVGGPKWPIIKELETTNLPVSSLRQSDSLTAYTDYKEGEI